MSRVLPHPIVSLFLLVAWLLLNRSISPGHIALGTVLALLWPLALVRLDFPRARLRRPAAMLKLAGLVARDILRSNFAVGKIVTMPDHHGRTSAFMTIPLEMRSPHGLVALGCIVTATPGTLWVDFDPVAGKMMLHVLDLVDEDAWVRKVKGDYESLLMEIFE